MNEKNNINPTGLFICGICAFFYLYEFFLRTIIGTFQLPIIHDLNLSSFKFSFLSTTAYMITYGFMQIPVVFIVKRFGLKKSLFTGAIFCSIACLCFSSATNYYTAVLFRFFMGFGSSFGFICLLIAIYDWMPLKYNGLFIGISQFIGIMGPFIAAEPIHYLTKSNDLNWRVVFFSLGLIGFVLTTMVITFVKNNHEKIEKYIILKRHESIRTNIKNIFSRRQPWIIAIFCACSYFAIEYLSENEGISFLVSKGFSSNFSASMISLSWLAYAIGCPLLGLISDLTERRKPVLVFAAFCSIISLLFIIYSGTSSIIFIGFILLGFGASGQSVGFAAIANQFKKQSITIGYGINNALITSLVAINSPCIGFFLDLVKKDDMPSLIEYKIVFSSLILVAFIATIFALFFVEESFCKSKVDFVFLKTKF